MMTTMVMVMIDFLTKFVVSLMALLLFKEGFVFAFSVFLLFSHHQTAY